LHESLDALGLIESADQAMYKAKRAGKNRIEIAA
jgi:PleD family two-component response regulator